MSKKYKCPHCPATFKESDISSLSVFTCGGCNKKVSIKKKGSPEPVSNNDALDWLGDIPVYVDPPAASPPKPQPKTEAPKASFSGIKKAPVGDHTGSLRENIGLLDITFKHFASVSVVTVLWVMSIVGFVGVVGLTTIGSAIQMYQGAGELPPVPDMSLTYSDFDSVTEYYDHLSDVSAYEAVRDYSPAGTLLAPLFAFFAGAIWLLFVRLGLELFVVIFRIYEELRAANKKR